MNQEITNKVIEAINVFLQTIDNYITRLNYDLQDEVREAVGYIKKEVPDEDGDGNFFMDTWWEDKDGNEIGFYPTWETRDALTLFREIDPEYLAQKRHQPIFNAINILICLAYLEWRNR